MEQEERENAGGVFQIIQHFDTNCEWRPYRPAVIFPEPLIQTTDLSSSNNCAAVQMLPFILREGRFVSRK